MIGRFFFQHGTNALGQPAAAMQIIEADIQKSLGRGWNDIGCAIADIKTRHLQRAWLEPIAAIVQSLGGQPIQNAHQPMHRIIGAFRIGGMALNTMHRDMRGHGTAPADFQRIAQRHLGCGFTHQRHVGDLIIIGHPFQHFGGAIDGRPFLIARDQQADAALMIRPQREEIGHARDESRDTAFHVTSAAAIDHAIGDLRAEWIMLPAGAITNRHHIRMPRIAKMRPMPPAAGE